MPFVWPLMNLYLAVLFLVSLPPGILAQDQAAQAMQAPQDTHVALRTEANLVLVPIWVGFLRADLDDVTVLEVIQVHVWGETDGCAVGPCFR
jgi:hypothetical protein